VQLHFEAWPVVQQRCACPQGGNSKRRSRMHLTLAGIVLTAGVTAALVAAAVCGIHGCAPRSVQRSGSEHQLPADVVAQQGPSTLVVQFTSPSTDALDVIPAMLHPYLTRLRLDSSLLQVREQA
jgi:hypothetical protein